MTPGVCPGGGFEAQVAVEIEVRVPQVHQTGLVHRRDAVLEDDVAGGTQSGGVAVGGIPELEVGPGHDVSGIRKGGHPLPVLEDRVPPDVVVVQMGVHHDVDVVGVDSCSRQIAQEVGVEPMPDGAGTVLEVAGTGVDEDRRAGAAQNPRLKGGDTHPPRTGVVEVGNQPVLVGFPGFGATVGGRRSPATVRRIRSTP